MDVNAILQERKRLRIHKEKIRECSLQRKFRQKQKYYNQELTEKLGKDILAEKKQSFYKELFEEGKNISQEHQELNHSYQKQNNLEIKQTKKNKREKKQIKKVFTQKNAKGQPILKNYLNLMIKKIEKEKFNKN